MDIIVTLFYLFILTAAFVIAFPRQSNNIYLLTCRNKDFVVVHILKTATRKAVVYFAVPNVKDKFITHIFGKNSYDLHPDDANFIYKNRKHYVFNEEDFMPMKLTKRWYGTKKSIDIDATNKSTVKTQLLDDKAVAFVYQGRVYYNSNDQLQPIEINPRVTDDYVWGSARVEQGVTAKSHRVLHGQESQLILLIAGIALLIAIAVAVYAVITIQDTRPLLDVIYAKVQPANITINGR